MLSVMARQGRRAEHAVFISYASRDRARAEAICAVLEADGLRCWIAPRDGTPGVPYATFLVDAIAASKLVVVVFSRSATRSEAVLNELEIAFNRKRPLLAVRIEDTQPTRAAEFYLRRRHWFDAFDGSSLAALPAAAREAMRRRVERAPSAPPAAPRTALPVPASTFFGREAELAQIDRALAESRLLTLWGTGGVGKTRLALEAARTHVASFHGGAWFVDLAPIADGAAVEPAVASAVGVREEVGTPLVTTIARALCEQPALLVLDNCEHVIAACAALVEALLREARAVRIIATSREPLTVDGERVLPVEPLAVGGEPAFQLFLDRAAAAGARLTGSDAEREAIATVVQRLDGIPFAIELAAARTRALTPAQIAAALDARLSLLTHASRTAAAKAQTLRGTLDWSYALLGTSEQIVLRRLAVFAGGWTLDALRSVVAFEPVAPWEALDALQMLVDKALVVAEPDAERYRLLETTREYACEKLVAADERAICSARHAAFFRNDVVQATTTWWTSGDDALLAALRPDRANYSAALDWLCGDGGDPHSAAAFAGALAQLWDFDGTQLDGLRRLDGVLAALPANAEGSDVAAVWLGVALLAERMVMQQRALDSAVRAAALAVSAGDTWLEARALRVVGWDAVQLGRLEDAERALARALTIFRERGDARGIASSLVASATCAAQRGEVDDARRHDEEALTIYRMRGETRQEIITMVNLAELDFAGGAHAAAIARANDALAIARAQATPALVVYLLVNLAAYLIAAEREDEAAPLVVELLAAADGDAHPVRTWTAIEEAAAIVARTGRVIDAKRLFAAADAALVALAYVPHQTELALRRRLIDVLGEPPAQNGNLAPASALREARALLNSAPSAVSV